MVKKILTCLLCVSLLCCAGCRRNDATGISEPISKMALITSDIELELDYNNVALWEGITSCGDASGIEYVYYKPEEITDEAISVQFEAAVNDGAKVIICMGDAFANTVAEMQVKYPNVKIVLLDVSASGVGKLEKNTHCIMFRQEQGAYMAGYASVRDGFTKLGFMGAHDTEMYQSYCAGFLQGANDAAIETETPIEVKIAYASDFEGEDQAIELCGKWYSDGTEIVMASGDDIFVQQCAECAVNNFGYTIGTNTDQSYIGSTYDYNPFMTSAMKGLREAIEATLEMMLAGSWDAQLGGQTVYFGLQNGNYIYLPDEESLWLFSGFSIAEYSELKEKISSGEVVVGKSLPKVNTEYVTLLINGEED